ncbi:MAG: DNA topoisomerase IV subunit B [Gammaproteobacteria bacterium]|nr:DNA topoisomerase IV subunit B [Gammaproteobacteria bacterium]
MKAAYRADDIEVLSGLDPVRRRPGMFTDTARPNYLAHEVIDNSVDEALTGHCKRIDVTLHEDGSLSVEDDGRGMPVDVHEETGLTGVELILTRLHAGAKFSRHQYRYSGGLHGVGVSVVNALSTQLKVRVRRDGGEWRMEFAGGETQRALEAVETVGKTSTGTWIRFWPDPRYFSGTRFHLPSLKRVLRAKALLCPGLSVSLTTETDGEKDEWRYEDGLSQYLQEESGDGERLPDEPLRFSQLDDEERTLDCVVHWAEDGSKRVEESYVNLVPTPRHGTHVNGLRTGLTEGLREFCEFHKLLPRDLKISPPDVWDGVNFVLSVKLAEPQFSGQMKESLASRDCAGFVAEAVRGRMALWLNQHSELGERIARQAIAAAQRRLKAARKTPRRTPVSGPALPGKLADCASTVPDECEIFLVEGDSAGGSARQARHREYQAILPLRGKILNTWEVDSADLNSSQEVHDIAVALGIEAGDSDLGNLRYRKVCILADADSDGRHIATLICALFARHFPELVRQGHVYVVMPPLYRLDVGKETHYALSDEERDAMLRRFGKRKVSVTRFKGLGEMSAKQLRETAMEPDTRRLIRLEMGAGDDAFAVLDMLLARKRAPDRRAWLEDKGDLAAG